MENKGVIEPIIGRDWVVGVSSQIPYEARCENWEPFISEPEDQFDEHFDSQGCVSFSETVQSVEMQMNWAKANGKFSQRQIDEMTALGYFKNGKFRFSRRFLAKMSGTTMSGNSQNVVAECLRKNGLIAEVDWPFTPDMTWNTFYAEIPQAIKDKALKIFNYVSIAYEWVISDNNPVGNYQANNQIILRELKQAPLQFTAPLCPSYYAKEKPMTTCPLVTPQHALVLYGLRSDDGALTRLVWDSYPPYKIEMANNYPIPYVLKTLVTALIDTATPPISDPTNTYPTIKPQYPIFWKWFWYFMGKGPRP